MDAGLIAMRMRLSGGKEVAAEAETATAAVEETAAATDAANKKVARSGNAIRSSLTKQISAIKTIGTSLTKYISVPLAAIAIGSGVMAAHFDRSMLLLHTQAGVAKKDLAGLEKSFLKISRETTFSPQEISEAGYRLAGAGLRGKKLEEATRRSAQLAMVGNANPEDTAKTLSQIWFTNIKGGKDFNKVIGELNATVGAGDLRLPQLVDALGTGVVAAGKQAGLSLQDVTGAMAVFGDETNNVSGWSAQLATALHYLYAPTEKAEGALNSLGLSGSKLGRALHGPNGLATALGMLKKPLEELPGGADGTQAAQVLSSILPGGRGRVLLVLLNQLDRLEKKERQIKGTTEEFGKSLKDTELQPQVKMERAWSNIQASMIEIGQVLLPIAVPMLQEAAHWVASIGADFGHLSPDTQKWIIKIGLIAAALGPVLLIVAKLLEMWKAIKELAIFSAASAGVGELGAATSLAAGGELGGFAMMGKAGKLVTGGAAVAASQVAGNAIGGKAGSVVSDIGTGAGIGFAVGGPMGAAVGATAGAVKAALPEWEQLLGITKRVSWQQQQLSRDGKNIASDMKAQGEAARGLANADHRIASAHNRVHSSAKKVQALEANLRQEREQGAGNHQIVRQEERITTAIDEHRAALRRLHHAERLRGVELSEFKTIARDNVLEQRNEINVLQRKAAHLNNEYVAMKKAGAGQEELKTKAEAATRVNNRLATAQQKIAETISEVAKKAGPKFATFLHNATRQVLIAGSQWKAFNNYLRETQELSEQIEAAGMGGPLTGALGGPMPEHPTAGPPTPHKGGKKGNTDALETHGSKALERLFSRGTRPRTVHHQPVVLALDPKGRRRIAEGVVEVQEDDDARS